MKKLIKFFYSTLFLVIAFSCTGLDDKLSGILKTQNDLVIAVDKKKVVIPPGQKAVKIRFAAGLYGIMDPKLVITYDNQDYKISVPRQIFDAKTKTFRANAKEIGQDFSLEGKAVPVLLREKDVLRTSSCEYCDFCTHDETETDSKGFSTTVRRFGSSCKCEGTEQNLYNIRTMQDSYTITFTNSNQSSNAQKDQIIASFIGDGSPYRREIFLKAVKTCGDHYDLINEIIVRSVDYINQDLNKKPQALDKINDDSRKSKEWTIEKGKDFIPSSSSISK
jgi:hypothetical protein